MHFSRTPIKQLGNNKSTTKYRKRILKKKLKQILHTRHDMQFFVVSAVSVLNTIFCITSLCLLICIASTPRHFMCLHFGAALTRIHVNDAYQLLFFQTRTNPPTRTRTIYLCMWSGCGWGKGISIEGWLSGHGEGTRSFNLLCM